jgi:hypothetical protein
VAPVKSCGSAMSNVQLGGPLWRLSTTTSAWGIRESRGSPPRGVGQAQHSAIARLARAEHAARLVRRPTLTAPARDDMGEARVGTKERLSDRTKKLMKKVRRRAETP